jgi:hypothetical protein
LDSLLSAAAFSLPARNRLHSHSVGRPLPATGASDTAAQDAASEALKLTRRMDALDWIALVTSHIPDPHQQMVRCYGRYSNASRGKRRKQTVPAPWNTGLDSAPQPDSPAQRFGRQRRRSWAGCFWPSFYSSRSRLR